MEITKDIKTLRSLTFNNGIENLTVARVHGNTVWLRNTYASMRSVNIKNLFDDRYFTIIN